MRGQGRQDAEMAKIWDKVTNRSLSEQPGHSQLYLAVYDECNSKRNSRNGEAGLGRAHGCQPQEEDGILVPLREDDPVEQWLIVLTKNPT